MKVLLRIAFLGLMAVGVAFGDWIEAEKIVQGSGDDNLSFGYSIDIDGDYAVVGAPDENGSYGEHDGAVYVFKKNSSGEFAAYDKVIGYFDESLGTDVAIKDFGSHGVFMAAGAPDYEFYNGKTHTTYYYDNLRIYELNTTSNHFEYLKVISNDDGTGLGTSVDIGSFIETAGTFPNTYTVDAGIIIVAGAPQDNRVSTYFYNTGTQEWKDVNLTVGAADDEFGFSVAVLDDRIYPLFLDQPRSRVIIGAPKTDVDNPYNSDTYPNRGAAYVYALNGTFSNDFNWVHETKIIQPISQYLITGSHHNSNSQFGYAVDISSKTIAIGALKKNIGSDFLLGADVGEVSILSLQNSITNEWGDLKVMIQPSNPSLGTEEYGAAVALDGNETVVVGAPAFRDDSNIMTGAVFHYSYNSSSTNWDLNGSYIGTVEGKLGTAVDIADTKTYGGDPENDSVSVLQEINKGVNPALLMYLLN